MKPEGGFGRLRKGESGGGEREKERRRVEQFKKSVAWSHSARKSSRGPKESTQTEDLNIGKKEKETL